MYIINFFKVNIIEIINYYYFILFLLWLLVIYKLQWYCKIELIKIHLYCSKFNFYNLLINKFKLI